MATTLSLREKEQLVQWINELRRDVAPAAGRMLRAQAREIYASDDRAEGAFQASYTWLRSVLTRHRLAFRRPTRQGQTTPADAAATAAAFGKKVRQRMKELGISKVYNADQTAVCYEYMPVKTIVTAGVKTVWVKGTGKSKEHVTAMVMANSDGVKCEPFLVFKTKTSTKKETAAHNAQFQRGFGRKLWNNLKGLQVGVRVYANETGWWNSALSVQFLLYHFCNREGMHVPVLLLWDDFSGHWREDVLITARLLNVELMRIPPKYAYACQPADISWNKPLKDSMRAQWVECMLRQLRGHRTGTTSKLKPPSRADMIAWIKNAWSSLSEGVIISGFGKAQLLPDALLAHATSSQATTSSDEPDWTSLLWLFANLTLKDPKLTPSTTST